MMPVLDTQLWIGIEARESTTPSYMEPNAPKITQQDTLKKVILYKFFKKPMASRTNNLFRGGIALGSKIATGTQEIIRQLKNTSREIEHEQITTILMDYMQKLREGGYPQNIRGEILLVGIKRYSKMWTLQCENQGFINRPGKATQN